MSRGGEWVSSAGACVSGQLTGKARTFKAPGLQGSPGTAQAGGPHGWHRSGGQAGTAPGQGQRVTRQGTGPARPTRHSTGGRARGWHRSGAQAGTAPGQGQLIARQGTGPARVTRRSTGGRVAWVASIRAGGTAPGQGLGFAGAGSRHQARAVCIGSTPHDPPAQQAGQQRQPAPPGKGGPWGKPFSRPFPGMAGAVQSGRRPGPPGRPWQATDTQHQAKGQPTARARPPDRPKHGTGWAKKKGAVCM
jgi:hypothetical protein